MTGVHPEALRNWIRQDEADHGERFDRPCPGEADELRRLRKENAELRRANEILKAASALSHRNCAPCSAERGEKPFSPGRHSGLVSLRAA